MRRDDVVALRDALSERLAGVVAGVADVQAVIGRREAYAAVLTAAWVELATGSPSCGKDCCSAHGTARGRRRDMLDRPGRAAGNLVCRDPVLVQPGLQQCAGLHDWATRTNRKAECC